MKWFEATDCPCNSLALNCLQMSCCMPMPASDGSSDLFEAIYKAVEDPHDADAHEASPAGSCALKWMDLLSKLEPDKRFRDLVIVGSHNAASYTIHPNKPFSAIGRCQNLPILQQLEAGIRLLDLRVGGKKGHSGSSHVNVWHGSLEGQPIIPILQQIDSFMTDHPSEIITINLQPEYGVPFSSDQKLFVLKRIHEMFQGRLVKSTEIENLLASWTLKSMQENNKQVICLFHPRFCRDFKASGTGLEWTSRELESEFDVINADLWMRNPWFNTRHVNSLFQMVLRDIQTHGNKKRHQFHCSQFVLTPGVGGMSDVIKAFIGTNSLRPISLSQQLYKDQELNKFLRETCDEPWNMFLVDFVDRCPWTVRFLTALNFPVRLEICFAVFCDATKTSKTVVTTEVTKHLKRQRAVFLTNVLEDLRVDDETQSSGGSLTVAYRIGGGSYYVLFIPEVDNSTSLMISYYATSAKSVVEVPTAKEGIFFDGAIITNKSYTTTMMKGAALKFQGTSSSECTFDLL